IRLLNLLALLIREFFNFANVHFHVVRKIVKLKGQRVGIGHPHYGGAACLSERSPIHKILVAEMGVPVEIVVDRMIDSSAILPADSDPQRSNTRKIDERGMVRTTAKHFQSQIMAAAQFA